MQTFKGKGKNLLRRFQQARQKSQRHKRSKKSEKRKSVAESKLKDWNLDVTGVTQSTGIPTVHIFMGYGAHVNVSEREDACKAPRH